MDYIKWLEEFICFPEKLTFALVEILTQGKTWLCLLCTQAACRETCYCWTVFLLTFLPFKYFVLAGMLDLASNYMLWQLNGNWWALHFFSQLSLNMAETVGTMCKRNDSEAIHWVGNRGYISLQLFFAYLQVTAYLYINACKSLSELKTHVLLSWVYEPLSWAAEIKVWLQRLVHGVGRESDPAKSND